MLAITPKHQHHAPLKAAESSAELFTFDCSWKSLQAGCVRSSELRILHAQQSWLLPLLLLKQGARMFS
jgi:hypothetical protein